MYDFIGTNEKQGRARLPSESLIINGRPMEELVQGFWTLSVTGRELRKRVINATDIQGRDGSMYIDSTLEPRTLTVKYKLETKSNREFRVRFNQLNAILQQEQLNIRFLDEPEYSYIGTLSDIEDVSEGRNTIVSSFSFYCSDPYKYSDPMEIEGENKVTSLLETIYPTVPDSITVIPSKDTSTITLRTNGKEIKLVEGSFLSGKEVTITFGDEIAVTSANGDALDKVALHSDLEEFYIRQGVPVEFVEGGTIKMKVRRVML